MLHVLGLSNPHLWEETLLRVLNDQGGKQSGMGLEQKLRAQLQAESEGDWTWHGL